MYQFNHWSNWLAPIAGRTDSLLRVHFVPHVADLPFLFQLPTLRDQQDRLVSDFYLDYILGFVTNNENVRMCAQSAAPWPEYQPGDEQYLAIDGNTAEEPLGTIAKGLRTAECDLWNSVSNDRSPSDASFGYNF